MKKLLSAFLFFVLLLCVALAEGVTLPDISAFSEGLLTYNGGPYIDDNRCAYFLIGNTEDVRRVAEAYMTLITERYDMELMEALVDDDGDYKGYDFFFSSAAHPEISYFYFDSSEFPDCQLFLDYSRFACMQSGYS